MLIALVLAVMCSAVMVWIGILMGYEMARRKYEQGQVQAKYADHP